MYVQSLRQGKARQLCLKTTPLFPKRKRRAASGGTRTRDVLRTKNLSHRSRQLSWAGRIFKGKGVSSLINRATHVSMGMHNHWRQQSANILDDLDDAILLAIYSHHSQRVPCVHLHTHIVHMNSIVCGRTAVGRYMYMYTSG